MMLCRRRGPLRSEFLPLILGVILSQTGVAAHVPLSRLAPLSPGHPAVAQGPDAEDLLRSTQPIVRDIARGQVHSLKLQLTPGQFFQATLLDQGLEATLVINDPRGRLVATRNCRPNDVAPVSLIARVGGFYRLDIRALAGSGRYEIKIDALRASTAVDRSRVAAEGMYAKAEQLQAEERVEASQQAIDNYKAAAAVWRGVGDWGQEAAALNRIGELYQVLSPGKSLTYYQQALAISRGAKDTKGEIQALNNLGYLHFFLGNTQQALDASDAALKLGRSAGDRRSEAQSLSVIGEANYGFGNMSKALEFQGQALLLWRELQDRRGQAQSLVASGYAYAQMSESQKAIDSFREALTLWHSVGSARGEALTLIALGNVQNKLGEKQDALNLYLQAKRLLEPIGDQSYEAYVHAHLAKLYRDMGENDLALDHNNRAVTLFRESGNRWGEAEALLGIGRIYSTLGAYQTALNYYRQSLETFHILVMPRLEAQTLRDMGKAYDALSDKATALSYYQRALEILKAGQDQREKAHTFNYIGGAYEGVGDIRKAVDYYDQALTLYRAAGDRQGEASSLYNIAHVDRSRGELDAARDKIESALRVSEIIRAKVARQDLRASFLASAHLQYELYTDVLMGLHERRPSGGYNITAFEVSERGRARSLLESLAEARASIRQGGDAGLLRREQELQQRLSAKAEQRIKLAGERVSPEEVAAIERDLNALTDEYRQVESQIRVSSPRYAALTQPEPLTLKEIQQRVLDADTVLLEYALGEERSFVWAVTAESIKSFDLPARSAVEKAARRVYELLTVRNRRVKGETDQQWQARARQADAQYTEASRALARMLLGPVAGELGQKRLIIVADGALQYVPFSALPAPETEKSGYSGQEVGEGGGLAGGYRPLIVEHEVVSLPSASVLALLRDELRGRRPAPKSVAVIADPVFDTSDERLALVRAAGLRRPNDAGPRRGELSSGGRDVATANLLRKALRDFDGLGDGAGIARLPFSRREAETIMATVPAGDGMLALGFRANRKTATAPELSQYRIIHFATHGLFNSEHPELSGIVLSLFDEAGRSQDGFLKLYEVYNLNLPADLVVLSACQTALGKEVRGEGLVGLTRGFMYAGAARVVASLWKVDDAATAELMGEFYKAMLSEGLRPAAALRTAQIHMWQQNRWRSPYFWAPFTIQGEWR